MIGPPNAPYMSNKTTVQADRFIKENTELITYLIYTYIRNYYICKKSYTRQQKVQLRKQSGKLHRKFDWPCMLLEHN